jgi:PAS domain S-box-containing protein
MSGSDEFRPTLAELFDDAACGLLVAAPNGTIWQANATLCACLGYAVSEIEGRRVQDLLTVGGRVFYQTHWAPLLQMQGSVAEVKVEMVTKDGRRVPMLINAVRRGEYLKAWDAISATVVTDRHQYEKELLVARRNAEASLASIKEAQQGRAVAEQQLLALNRRLSDEDRRKDEFLATLAHELRNPLAPMRNAIEVVKRMDVKDAQLRWLRELFDRQLQHLTHLVDDLLEISRITQGKLVLRKARIDLIPIARHVLEVARPGAEAAGLHLFSNFGDSPIWLDADPTRLSQIIQNLVNNSIKYTPRGGNIWLTIRCDGGEAVAEVRDTGIGIPKESLGSVFEMFSQLAPSLERAQGGLGIGLALVHGLVRMHGGTIIAESEGIAQGSTFVVRLPVLLDDKGFSEEADSRLDKDYPVRRILIVDDNVDAADSLAMLLELENHIVKTSYGGHAAISLAADFLPEVILLDIGLPDINGYEIARKIRSEPWGSGIIMIAVTGWGKASDKVLAVEAGFDGHFTKPLNLESLISFIQDAH